MQTILETVRRWGLIVGLFLSVLMATWTDFRPFYAVAPLSKWDKLELPRDSAIITSPDADQLLAERFNTHTPVVTVDPDRWQQWFTYITDTFEQGSPPVQWLHRLTSDDVRDVRRQQKGKSVFKPDIRRVVFAENEEPIASLFPDRKPDRSVIVSTVIEGRRYDAKIYYSAAPKLQGFGFGIYGVPEAFSYPLRCYWLCPLIVMLAGYCVIPRARHAENICAYKGWQIVLCDFAGCLLYGMFMVLPFFIIGGAQKALTEDILISAIFWSLAALGLVLLWFANVYAVFQIQLLHDRIVFVTPSGVKAVAYSDISSIEPVCAVPPKWLIAATLVSALFARGSARLGAAGRASLLASSSSDGLCLGTTDGSAIYIWLTNAMGQQSLSNVNVLLHKLEGSPAKQLNDVREFEVIFPPFIEEYGKRKTSKIVKRDQGGERLLVQMSHAIEQMDDEESDAEIGNAICEEVEEENGKVRTRKRGCTR
jgi:hypothetical protein